MLQDISCCGSYEPSALPARPMAPRGWLGVWEPNASAVCHGLNNTAPSPVSIVIPHMGGRRHNNLGHLIAFLLSQRLVKLANAVPDAD